MLDVYLKRYEQRAINQPTIPWVAWKPKPNGNEWFESPPAVRREIISKFNHSISMGCAMLIMVSNARATSATSTRNGLFTMSIEHIVVSPLNCTTTRNVHRHQRLGAKWVGLGPMPAPFHVSLWPNFIAEYLDRSFTIHAMLIRTSRHVTENVENHLHFSMSSQI